jgi:hypothetical protein
MLGRGSNSKRCVLRKYCGSNVTDVAFIRRFYGLRGLKLNIAIAVIAGTDFALFGYDQVTTFASIDPRQYLIVS